MEVAGPAPAGQVARVDGVYICGRDAHRIEAVLRHGLRAYRRDGITVPADVLVVVEEVSDVATEYRTAANGSSPAVKTGRFGSMEIMDVEAAAEAIGCRPRNVRRLITAGELPAQKSGGRWLVNRIDVEDLRTSRSKR